MAQVGALIALRNAEEKQMPLKELEHHLHVAQSTAAGIVVRLEQKGFLESFGSSNDRRIKMVRITPKGEECCLDSDRGMEQAEQKLLHSLTQEEKTVFLDLLEKVCNGMK